MLSSLRMVLACGAASAVVGAGSALVVTTATSDDAVPVSSPMYGCMDVTAGSLYLSDSGTCADDLVPVTWQGGPEAAEGAAGADGEDGSNGQDGEDGLDGAAGSPGAAGAQGAAGANGEDGADGQDGATGATGAKGADGATGAKGDDGATGATGEKGADGAKGDKGDDGAAGAKGEKGDDGETGATGATGAKGDRGDDGLVPWSAVSSWSASTTYSAGPPAAVVTRGGSTYVAARSSIAADPATSPADWILVAAAGAKGDKGDRGDKGETGEQGEMGATGAAGADGEAGATGAAGAEGPAGPAGPTGPAGPQGPQGIQGPAGNSLLSGEFNQWQGSARAFRDDYDCTVGTVVLGVGWRGVPADGRILPISQYQALFSLLGTYFGGNGSTTFAVPDLRAVTPNGLRYSICNNGIYPSSE